MERRDFVAVVVGFAAGIVGIAAAILGATLFAARLISVAQLPAGQPGGQPPSYCSKRPVITVSLRRDSTGACVAIQPIPLRTGNQNEAAAWQIRNNCGAPMWVRIDHFQHLRRDDGDLEDTTALANVATTLIQGAAGALVGLANAGQVGESYKYDISVTPDKSNQPDPAGWKTIDPDWEIWP